MNIGLQRRIPRGFMGPAMNNGAASPDLSAVMAAFDGFRAESTRTADQVRQLTEGMDEISLTLGALRMTGGKAAARRDLAPFASYLRSGSPPANSGMTTDSSPDGGYMVPENVDGIIQNQQVSLSPLRAYASIVILGGGAGRYSFNVNRRGAASGWVGERAARSETATPQLANIAPSEGELYANPKVSQWLLDDAGFNVEAFLQENVSDEFAVQEGAAFVTGDSINKPSGYLTRPTAATKDAVRDFGTLQYFPTGAAANFKTDGTGPDVLIDMVYGLRSPFRVGPGVAWMMNSTTASVIRKFKDAEGRYIWTDGLKAGEPAILHGYPVAIDENMPDLGAGSFPVAFGNWRLGYRIVDRMGTRVLRDPLSNKPFVHFYTIKRVGGAVADSDAIKLLKCATS